jgi:hypothetical protein
MVDSTNCYGTKVKSVFNYIGILGESKKLGSKRFAHFAGFAS